MTQQEDADIRLFMKNKIKEIDDRHKNQKNWLLGIIGTLILAILAVGVVEVRTTQRNKDDIVMMKLEVNDHVDYTTIFRVIQTFDLEFRAITAYLNGDADELIKITEEIKEMRWSLIEDDVGHSVDRGNPTPVSMLSHE